MSEDYYTTLETSRESTQDEIKKAYRKLAMKYHPDRNQGDKEAEEKFKEINAAYEVLSDENKRRQYDQLGHQRYTQNGRGASGMSAEDIFASVFGGDGGDIFSSFFGGGFSRQSSTGPQAGNDLRYDLEIGFKEAVFGTEKEILVPRSESCERCSGSGAEPGSKRKTCPTCNGQGQVLMSQGFFNLRQTCSQCRGEGTILENPCTDCRGAGSTRKNKKLNITIPPGVDNGTRLRVSGEGDAGKRGGPPGDLYIFLYVKKHEFFERDNLDIHCKIDIPFTLAALGGKIDIPTISGKEELKIPAGIQSNQQLRMRGKGVSQSRRGRGDQYIHISVEVPKNLSNEQKKKLKEFADLCSDNQYPKATKSKKDAKKHL